MKTLKQVQKELSELKDIFGFNPNEVEQGSSEWLHMKLGVISASNISRALSKKGSATRDGYMAELVAQIATREKPEINARPLEWGKENELAARSIYEFEMDTEFKQVPIIFKDKSMRCAVSPDGYGERPLELKCPFSSRVFIEFVCSEKIKKEYIDQCQYSMWVTNANFWDFANYDPRMTKKQFHCVTIERDEKKMKEFDEKIPEFISEMDEMLSKLGIEFGYQWHKNIEKVA